MNLGRVCLLWAQFFSSGVLLSLPWPAQQSFGGGSSIKTQE